MFKGDGGQRSVRQNASLAGPLALVAGMVNTLGFLALGVFTSHVTGHAGKLATEFAAGRSIEAWASALRMLAFFGGAFMASLVIESPRIERKPYAYSGLLFVEAALLVGFLLEGGGAQFQASGVLALCAAMGLQNGLVTRLSGAVVRTTHLTGVVTDLGIEAARWLGALLARARVTSGSRAPAPSRPKAQLLLTILVAFIGGGIFGAWAFARFGAAAFVCPVILLILGGCLAFKNGMETLGPSSRQ